jgi:aspartate racemase
MQINQTIGVLGGMGPLASAGFVRTIYGMYRGRIEQECPQVVLYSNPSIGDRTATFLSGGDCEPMLRELEQGIRTLLLANADEIVICCVTMHYLLPRLPFELRRHVISLIDTAIDEIRGSGGKCLLACTTGSCRLGLFQRHKDWPAIERRMVLPDQDEQERLHQAIYALKRTHSTKPLIQTLHSIAARQGATSIVCGCTELHLISEACSGPNSLNQQFQIIDPLSAIARLISEEQYASTVCA